MARWEEAADTAALTPDECKHVSDAIAVLETCGPAIAVRMATNFRAELRVPHAAWEKIFRALKGIDVSVRDEVTANRVLAALRMALTACLVDVPNPANVPSRKPVGPVVSGLKPKAYGRLITLPALVNCWKGRILTAPSAGLARRPKPPSRVVRDLIEDLQTPGGVASRLKSRSFGQLPLGFYVLWSTFDGETFDADPFPPRPARLGALAALLGTDDYILFDRPKPPRALCVLLSYRLPAPVEPRVPTIVEAYAGTGRLNYYFEVFRHEVSVAQKQFPRTLPIPFAQHQRGVPEVVHEVVFADQLSMPVELAHF